MGPLERAWRGGRNDWRLHLLSVFSVAVAFVCLATALLVLVNVEGVRVRWARAAHASIYLKSGATTEQKDAIERALSGTPGVVNVHFVSASDARRELLKTQPDDLLAALPETAFPASVEFELGDDAVRERLAQLSQQLSALPYVEAVETYDSWARRLESLLAGGMTASLILGLVVLCAVVSVVSSTIRLTLQRRRTEVEVLRLVGATESYMRRPFVIEGGVQGLTGASLAVLLLGVLHLVVRSHFDDGLAAVLGTTPVFLPWFVVLGMIGAGGVLGALSAHFSLRGLSTS